MKLHRFSPIGSETELMKALEYLHVTAHQLCREVVGTYLPVRGNLGVFCHTYEEFEFLTGLCAKMTYMEPNYKGKYYPLKQPIHFAEKGGIPAVTYEYLYIRQVDPYRSQVGDVDFYASPEVFERLKRGLVVGDFQNGARLFERPEENMIELWLPHTDVISYVAADTIQERIAVQRPDIAGVVAQDEQGRYLLVQEKRADVYGKWNLPAGHVNQGETSREAAIREAHEETGYDFEIDSAAPAFHEYDERSRRSFYVYRAEVTGGTRVVATEELLDVAWLAYEDIVKLHAEGDMRASVMYRAIIAVDGP